MKAVSTLALIALGSAAVGQDIHFSQFWASPLNLNPAQTGFHECTYRATAIYRTQWNSVNSPYKTFSVSYDHLFNSPLLAGDVVGAGLVLYNDVAGDAKFSNLSVFLNGAYHKVLGPQNMLTLGVQAGLTQKSLKYEYLKFPNMFNPADQTFSLPPNDALYGGPNISNFDLTIGLQYSQNFSSGTSFHLGATGLHLLTPTETFSANGSSMNELPMRLVGHGGLSFPINNKMTINPKALYMGQAGAREFIYGADLGYKIDNPKYQALLHGGLWHRLKDAVIPYFGLDYKSFRFGMSYDVNISSLKEASHGKGAFEVSLSYVGCLTTTPTVLVPPCIRI
jgi:type IX secretion system PorP/SprF family membrane protein